jgi:hypothetical protein
MIELDSSTLFTETTYVQTMSMTSTTEGFTDITTSLNLHSGGKNTRSMSDTVDISVFDTTDCLSVAPNYGTFEEISDILYFPVLI